MLWGHSDLIPEWRMRREVCGHVLLFSSLPFSSLLLTSTPHFPFPFLFVSLDCVSLLQKRFVWGRIDHTSTPTVPSSPSLPLTNTATLVHTSTPLIIPLLNLSPHLSPRVSKLHVSVYVSVTEGRWECLFGMSEKNYRRGKRNEFQGWWGEPGQTGPINDLLGKDIELFGLIIVSINLSFKSNLIYLCVISFFSVWLTFGPSGCVPVHDSRLHSWQLQQHPRNISSTFLWQIKPEHLKYLNEGHQS